MDSISFQNWTSITLSPFFLIASLLFFIIPLIIYLIIASLRKGRSSSGNYRTKCMLFYFNSWISIFCFEIFGLILYILLIIYPLWLKIF